MRLFALALVLLSGAAQAQTQEIQKQLIQRDQQTDAFALQLRQSQEALKISPVNRAAFESRQLWERQRLDNLGEKQRLEVSPETLDALRSYERRKAEDERRLIVSPLMQ